MQREPKFTSPSEGRVICIVGDVYRFLATGEETDNRFAQWEATVPPGGGPPPHVHQREEEAFYVLEGEITFRLGDQKIVAGPGMFASIPPGKLHSFKNETNKPVRMLIQVVPAGLENMFFEVGQPLNADGTVPATPADEIPRMLAAAERYGIEFAH